MSDIKLVHNIREANSERWNESARWLRELADRFEAGEIQEMVCVINDIEGNCFHSFCHFDDRWRILGALEYAKNSVHGN